MGEPAAPAKLASSSASRTPWAWVAGTFCGIGLIGKGGGTIASIATAGIWYAIGAYLHLWTLNLSLVTVACAVLAVLVGIPAGTIVARELGKKDPSEVVVDEVAGQLIALIGAPAGPLNWKYVLASVILFRIFDIFKPPPLRRLEALPTGTGIMMDDVGAGIYALIVVQLLQYVHAFAIFS
jgi:phosphatidylglycerophosphatase A